MEEYSSLLVGCDEAWLGEAEGPPFLVLVINRGGRVALRKVSHSAWARMQLRMRRHVALQFLVMPVPKFEDLRRELGRKGGAAALIDRIVDGHRVGIFRFAGHLSLDAAAACNELQRHLFFGLAQNPRRSAWQDGSQDLRRDCHVQGHQDGTGTLEPRQAGGRITALCRAVARALARRSELIEEGVASREAEGDGKIAPRCPVRHRNERPGRRLRGMRAAGEIASPTD